MSNVRRELIDARSKRITRSYTRDHAFGVTHLGRCRVATLEIPPRASRNANSTDNPCPGLHGLLPHEKVGGKGRDCDATENQGNLRGLEARVHVGFPHAGLFG